MESNYKVVLFIDKYLNIADPLSLVRDFVESPFKRFELGVVGRDIFIAKDCFGTFFSQTNCPVFNGSKYSRRHVCVVHQLGTIIKQSLSKKFASFDCCWSKFKSTVLYISDCIDVRHVGLFMVIYFKFAIFESLKSCSCQV